MARINKPPEGRRDVFQNVLDAKDPETGQPLPLPEMLSEVAVLIVAGRSFQSSVSSANPNPHSLCYQGSDTTSSALAATLFYLSRNTTAYTKLAHEIRTTFSSVEDIVSGPTLRSCTYLRVCIDESLRLSPPVSAAPWRVVKTGDAQIDVEDIPSGTFVGTCLYALHVPVRSAP